MSISSRRNSLRKSSISIDSIRKTVTSFTKGINSANQKSDEIVKITKERNLFKRTLVRKDGEFFARRRENIRRKDREDELESSSVTGVAKKQGNIAARSTRGFLGRLLDFLGIVLLGWAVNNLPMILEKIRGLFKLIQRVVGVLRSFLDGIMAFLTAIGTAISNALGVFKNFSFGEQRKQIIDETERVNAGLAKLDKDFRESISDFVNDENISQADSYADEFERKVQQSRNDRQQIITDINTESLVKPTVPQETTVTPEVEPRAEGGPVQSNKPFLVGEEGPEIFVPASGGEIVPNDQLVANTEEGVDMKDDNEEEGELFEGNKREVEELLGITQEIESTTEKSDLESQVNVSSGGVFDPDLKMVEKSEPTKEEKVKSQEKDISSTVSPVKRKERKMRGRRKPNRVVMVIEKPANQNQQVIMSSGSKKTSVNIYSGKSSKQTLLDLQSIASLKYT
tara:strand:+ start:70 stop:1434 length:1365 start_codon:yes stop_codon:yes gene_type:complete